MSPQARLISGHSTLSVLRRATNATAHRVPFASAILLSATLLLSCHDATIRSITRALVAGSSNTETRVPRVGAKSLPIESHVSV